MERDDWNQRYEGSGLLWTAEPNVFLVAEVGSLHPGRALDLGCGEGRNAVWLAEQGWSVTAVDFSDVAVEKGRRLAAARRVSVEWQLVDLRVHEPSAGAYDLVVVLYLHLAATDRRAVHAAAAAALRPGGTLLVLGHDSSNLTEGPRRAPGPVGPVQPAGRRRRPPGAGGRAGRAGDPSGDDRRRGAGGDRRPRPGRETLVSPTGRAQGRS